MELSRSPTRPQSKTTAIRRTALRAQRPMLKKWLFSGLRSGTPASAGPESRGAAFMGAGAGAALSEGLGTGALGMARLGYSEARGCAMGCYPTTRLFAPHGAPIGDVCLPGSRGAASFAQGRVAKPASAGYPCRIPAREAIVPRSNI